MNKLKIAFIVFFVSALFFAIASIAAPPVTFGDDWSMFRHDPEHTGSSASQYSNGRLLWQCFIGTNLQSSPAVVNGVVYIGSNDSYVYALNAANGSKIWQYTTVGSHVSSSPAVVDAVVYVGAGAYVYALNATNGSKIWQYDIGSGVDASPTVKGGVVYVGSYNGKVYALNASTGSPIWSFQTGGPVFSPPAVVNGSIFVGSSDGYVYALNATNGFVFWSFLTGGGVYSSPAVLYDIVYVGSNDTSIYALRASDGLQMWHRTTEGRIETSPAVAEYRVYVASSDGMVCSIDAFTGALVWSIQIHNARYSSPVVGGGHVFVGSWDGYVYALNTSSASISWSFNTGGYLFSSPAVVDGVVYVSSFSGYVYALGAIALSPTSGPVGSTVTFRAVGLPYSTQVTATFGYAPVTLSSSTTDAEGSLSATFKVPASTSGNKLFQLIYGKDEMGIASYVVTPSLSLSPTSGRVNSTVTIDGTGFAATSQITATFDGLPLTLNGTIKTNAVGSFSTTFIVPNSAPGIRSVFVTDSSANSASSAYNVTSVIQTVTVTISGSAPSATVIVAGGNPSPSTFLADGIQHSIILDQGSQFTLSFSNSGNVRNGFKVSNVFSATSSPYSASTSPISITAYQQLNNTFSVSGVSGTDSIRLTGTYLGTASSTGMTLNSSNNWSAPFWSDYGAAVVFPATTTNSGSNERWSIGDAYATPVLTTGGSLYSKQYYHQYLQTLSCTVVGGGTPLVRTAVGLAFGSTYLTPLMTSPTAYWFDASGSITFGSLTIGSSERWIPNPASVSATSPSSLVVSLNHQYQVTFKEANLGSDVLDVLVTINGVTKGYSELPFSLWVDSSGSVTFTYTAAAPSSSLGKQYALKDVSAASPLTITGAITVTANYKTQYYLNASANFGSVSSGSGWHDAGSNVTISATAPSAESGERYVWGNWTGTGSGNYTGTDAQISLMMNGPINETATWTHQYMLTVISQYGSPTPTTGWFDEGTSIQVGVNTPVAASIIVQYGCTGWTGTGSVPTSGTTNSTTFTIYQPSSITWTWETKYLPIPLLTIALIPTVSIIVAVYVLFRRRQNMRKKKLRQA